MGAQLRLGLFGGSFDPVHSGHIALALQAKRILGLDRVIFIPAMQPPHKKKRRLTPPAHRLRMLLLALRPYPDFSVSLFELNRTTTTYTYQTLRHFRRIYPRARLYFIIGSDSLAELSTWKNADRLFSLASFAVGKRKGSHPAAAIRDEVCILPRPVRDISSSRVREMVAGDKRITGAVPAAVNAYIKEKGLYR